MKNNTHIKNFLQWAGIIFLVTGFTSCSDDDENFKMPTGVIQVNEFQNLTGKVLIIPQVTVGQDSWLAAVEVGEELTNNFIAQPVLIEKGVSDDVELTFDETAIDYLAGSQQVVLKLYADDPNGGIKGEWDLSDKPITYSNNILVTKTITIIADLTGFDPFNYFDTNKNGVLDVEEISETYFIESIYGNKTGLSMSEFYSVMFHTTDVDYYDAGITEAEWDQGYSRMFSNWTQDHFSIYDVDKDARLFLEEWNKIFNESEWFESYDKNSDNSVSKEELRNGLYGDWDQNKDGVIDKEEFLNYRGFIGNLSDGSRPM